MESASGSSAGSVPESSVGLTTAVREKESKSVVNFKIKKTEVFYGEPIPLGG